MKLKTQEEIDREVNEIVEKLSSEDIEEINSFFAKCNLQLEEERKKPGYTPPNWSVEEMFQMCLQTLKELEV